MAESALITSRSRVAPILASVAGFIVLFFLAMWLRLVPLEPDPVLQGYLQVTTGLLAFVFAAVILVRFQGTQDRISLILGAGFLLSGTILTASSLLFFQFQQETQMELRWAPVSWWVSRMVLALLFVVALIWYRRRLELEDSAFDRTIYAAAWMNLAAQLVASQSQRLLDSPFVLAQALTVTSYAVALGGALLDNARLFEQVSHLAVSDPLTGLANYRRLLDVLETETERTNRNGRPFAVLLLDLDGLKKINDTHGHLVGSHALNRLAHILRIHCRAIDTAARYGGDEFALVLPETLHDEADRVANRIRAVLASDPEQPQLSASIGIAIYNGHGERIEKLLSDADAKLYFEKARRAKRHPTPLTPRHRTQKA